MYARSDESHRLCVILCDLEPREWDGLDPILATAPQKEAITAHPVNLSRCTVTSLLCGNILHNLGIGKSC